MKYPQDFSLFYLHFLIFIFFAIVIINSPILIGGSTGFTSKSYHMVIPMVMPSMVVVVDSIDDSGDDVVERLMPLLSMLLQIKLPAK